MTRIIRAGIVQQSCSTDIKTNLEKLHRNIASLAQAGANLVVLQELHNTPYFCLPHRIGHLIIRTPCTGTVSQYSRCIRYRRKHSRYLPQNAHPRRPCLLRKILFHSRRHRLRTDSDFHREIRRTSLLGPMVSRRSTAHGTERG